MAKASKKAKPNKPQSKSYSPKRDKKELAKPLGWRFTDAGAKVLGVKPNAKPTRDQIAKYKDKATRKGDRYMYQEKRIDKSDMSQKKKFASGGKVGRFDIDTITKHYAVAALWSSNDMGTDEPLDANFDIDNISDKTIKKMKSDVKKFVTDNKEALEKSGLDDEQIGHDFWLTRNHHGAGFFDRGLDEDVEKQLMDASHKFGEVTLEVGDDRQIHELGVYSSGGEVSRRAYNVFQSRTFEEQNAKIDQYKADKNIDTPTPELAKDIDKAGQDHEFFTWYGSHYADGGEAYAKGGKTGGMYLPNCNLLLYGFGRDTNGNSTVKVGYPNKSAFSIQINDPHFHFTKEAKQSGKKIEDISQQDALLISKEIVTYIEQFGSKTQKERLRQYEAGGAVDIPIGSTRSGDIEDRKKPSDFFAEGGEVEDYDDPIAAREIELFAENDQQLYRSRWIPILKNYKKKLDKGTFDLDKAADGMKYYVDAADKRYQAEFGGEGRPFLLSSKDRKLLSMKLAKFVKAEYDVNKLEGYFEEGGIAAGQTSMFGAGGDVETFKREISLGKIDYNGRGRKANEASLNIEIRSKDEVRDWDTLEPLYNVPEVSMSGNVWNTKKTDILAGGQIVGDLSRYLPGGEKKAKFKRLVAIWKDYHLNDMQAGTIRQTEALEKAGITGSEYNYDKAVEHLKLVGLYEDNGYKYGHGWLYQPVPETVLAEIKEIANQFPEFSRYEEGGEISDGSSLADSELSDPIAGEGDMMFRKGGAVRIPNQEAREYAENRLPFQANNLEGKTLDNGDYVVMSYGTYPIWYYKASEAKWYGNTDKYSNTTARHISQSRPDFNATLLPHRELTDKMMEDVVRFDLGGIMIRQLDEGPVVDNTLIAHAGAANTTFR